MFRLKSLDGAKTGAGQAGRAEGCGTRRQGRSPQGPDATAKAGDASCRRRKRRRDRRRRERVRPRRPGGGLHRRRLSPLAWRPTGRCSMPLRGGINSYDLLGDIKAGKVKLDSLKEEELPDELRKLPKEKRQAYLDEIEKKREKLRAGGPRPRQEGATSSPRRSSRRKARRQRKGSTRRSKELLRKTVQEGSK